MTNIEYEQKINTFIDHFEDQIQHDGHGDPSFDKERMEEDVKVFRSAANFFKMLENNDSE